MHTVTPSNLEIHQLDTMSLETKWNGTIDFETAFMWNFYEIIPLLTHLCTNCEIPDTSITEALGKEAATNGLNLCNEFGVWTRNLQPMMLQPPTTESFSNKQSGTQPRQMETTGGTS
jgi:hypothetical protein